MKLLNVENLLLNIFQSDIDLNKDFTFISQLTVITIKSLLPDNDLIGNRIDYKRYYEELRLWQFYKMGEYSPILNAINKVDLDTYFSVKDEICFNRIIPVIISNNDFKLIQEEIIKNILYITGNIESLLESLVIGKLIFLLMSKEEDVIDKLKNYLINFSQVDYLENFGEKYLFPISQYPRNFMIIFEREKLKLLNILHGVTNNSYTTIQEIINILSGENYKTLLGKIIYESLDNKLVNYNLPEFYINLNEYLFRLKKSRIDPSTLEISEYVLPDIFSFKENEIFYHSLLKKAIVIKKEVRDNILTSLVQTKSGMYLFRRPN